MAAAEELPDEFVFRTRIKNLNSFAAHKGAEWSLGHRKDCLKRCQSSEDGMFVALVHWMDEALVCEQLLLLSRQLSPPHGSFMVNSISYVNRITYFFNK